MFEEVIQVGFVNELFVVFVDCFKGVSDRPVFLFAEVFYEQLNSLDKVDL